MYLDQQVQSFPPIPSSRRNGLILRSRLRLNPSICNKLLQGLKIAVVFPVLDDSLGEFGRDQRNIFDQLGFSRLIDIDGFAFEGLRLRLGLGLSFSLCLQQPDSQ